MEFGSDRHAVRKIRLYDLAVDQILDILTGIIGRDRNLVRLIRLGDRGRVILEHDIRHVGECDTSAASRRDQHVLHLLDRPVHAVRILSLDADLISVDRQGRDLGAIEHRLYLLSDGCRRQSLRGRCNLIDIDRYDRGRVLHVGVDILHIIAGNHLIYNLVGGIFYRIVIGTV